VNGACPRAAETLGKAITAPVGATTALERPAAVPDGADVSVTAILAGVTGRAGALVETTELVGPATELVGATELVVLAAALVGATGLVVLAAALVVTTELVASADVLGASTDTLGGVKEGEILAESPWSGSIPTVTPPAMLIAQPRMNPATA
jgi:hypothetical protein